MPAASATPRRKRRQVEQETVHRPVVLHLRARAAAGVFFFHVPNGGRRSAVEAAIMQGLGVRAGMPDIVCIKAGQAYGLELKAEKGTLSANQRQCHDDLRAAGAIVGTATGLSEALVWLEGHGLLRGVADVGR
jgi:hypothetical protein